MDRLQVMEEVVVVDHLEDVVDRHASQLSQSTIPL